MKKLNIILIAIVVVSLLGNAYLYFKPPKADIDYKIFLDSITVLKNENHTVSYRLEAAIFDKIDLLNEIVTKDKQIKLLTENAKQAADKNIKLQQMLGYNSKLIAEYQDSLRNQIVGYDTVGGTVNPIVRKVWFETADSTKYPFKHWIYQSIVLGVDTFNTKLIINDYPIITFGTESNGWFKKPTTFGYVTPSNPFVTVESMKVVVENNEPSPAKKAASITVPILIGLIIGILL